MSTSTLRPDDILRRASAVGNYYGFTALSSAAAAKRASSREPYPENLLLDELDVNAREVAGFLKHVRDAGLAPSTTQPLFLWHTNASRGRPAPKQLLIQFHALGVDHSIADAVLIRAIRALITDLTKDAPQVRVNSMGDKETRSRFARELGVFFRKQSAALSPDCVACSKRDVFEAAEMVSAGDSRDELPSPTDHLSEASRKHFENLLEYLEATDTPYELAPDLLSRGTTWTETCFSIHGDEHVTAWGSRYQDLAKHFFKSPLPSIGAIIRISLDERSNIPPLKERAHGARFVFVHIGDEAKRESMKMTDALRKARIPLTQAIGIQSLSEQMRFAETLNPPYLLIMGRKEALERSVILRERATHTETFIPFDLLIDTLKQVA
ncbi:MAG: His/Gly/Thr/Pro-type tRNA ligase C-terminal domain-containing protein [Candidatus Pacebacteria bacterium]|nr:His/Gly/Thr/Pro-type tRNA ligase C-terminal domain-containing protein [Candidatus Paceibacterota bacterium]